MAENKKSVILYVDIIHTFEELTDAQAGRLIKHFLRYVNDKNPKPPDKITKIIFEPIKQQLKRDLQKWEQERITRSKAGKKGMASRWKSKAAITKDNGVMQPITNITDNVTVNDTVNVIENTGQPDLKNSNLFRKPIIPTKNEVLKAITDAGGTKEMAKSFYEKHESTGWFLNGSPIVSYKSLASRFVTNWNGNEKEKNNHTQTGPTLPILNKPK